MVTGSNGVRWRDHLPLPERRATDKRWLDPHREIARKSGFLPSAANIGALTADIATHMRICVLLQGEKIQVSGAGLAAKLGAIPKKDAYGALRVLAEQDSPTRPLSISLEDLVLKVREGAAPPDSLADIFESRNLAQAIAAERGVQIEWWIMGTQKAMLATMLPGEMRRMFVELERDQRIFYPSKPLSKALSEWKEYILPELDPLPSAVNLNDILSLAG